MRLVARVGVVRAAGVTTGPAAQILRVSRGFDDDCAAGMVVGCPTPDVVARHARPAARRSSPGSQWVSCSG